MSKFCHLAIIGVGPSAIYLLKHLLGNFQQSLPSLTDIYLLFAWASPTGWVSIRKKYLRADGQWHLV